MEPQIASKRNRFCKGKDDRISALPNSVLLEILSRLPSTKDAIKTGTLSKRWEHLWTSVPTLIFDYEDCNLRLSDFVSFVDKTLSQCRQLKLKKFELNIRYETRFASQINSWIRHALSRNVEELKLGLGEVKVKAFVLDQYFLTSSCFTDLTFQGCTFNPTEVISWKNLRSLCISCAYINEAMIENILSGSPVLETLKLDFCHGYKLLNITSKSVKNLVLCGYIDYLKPSKLNETTIIEINAPNILSLTIESGFVLRNILLLNVSSLVEANLDYTKFMDWLPNHNEMEEEILKGLILKLLHVKELNIGATTFKVLSRLQDKDFMIPSNVKCEVLEVDIRK